MTSPLPREAETFAAGHMLHERLCQSPGPPHAYSRALSCTQWDTPHLPGFSVPLKEADSTLATQQATSCLYSPLCSQPNANHSPQLAPKDRKRGGNTRCLPSACVTYSLTHSHAL